MPDNKQTCAFYCRVANDTQGEPAAIELQRQKLVEYARQIGYDCTATYMDNGYSGLDPERPGFVKLNADILAGKVKAVLVADPARLWRNMGKGVEWLSRMDKLGVTVLCMDSPDFQKQLSNPRTEFAQIYKRKKRKQERHTVRTPPPQSKAR